jgi:hypothetical protein
MTHASLNGDLPRIDADQPARPRADIPGENAGPTGSGHPTPKHEAALRAALATTHARYHRAMQDAQRDPDPTRRRAAFAEARRLAAHASRLQARLHDE